MHQHDINKDLKHYLHDRKKRQPFWSKIFGKKNESKKETKEEIKEDIETMAQEADSKISQEDKKEFHEMEKELQDANEVEEIIEDKREGLLGRFFKKLNFQKKKESDNTIEEPITAIVPEDEMKEFLKMVHSYIVHLPSDKLQEFKKSKDFELYTKILKHYDLIKK